MVVVVADTRDPIEGAMFSVVSRLADLLFALPQPDLMFLRAVQDSWSETSNVTDHQSFALKVYSDECFIANDRMMLTTYTKK